MAPRPLRLDLLAARGFRNLSRLELRPGPHFNVIHGDNGAGKSNLLEAIHYLGALRSFRSAKTTDMVALGRPEARLAARLSVGTTPPRRFEITLPAGRARRLTIDGKRPRSIARWHEAVQMVLFHPGHLELAIGSAEPRRAFLDRVLEQMDGTYATTLASYHKALRSRNRLLKVEGVDRRSITAYDELLASAGEVIGRARARLIEDLAPLAEQAFEEVVGSTMPIHVRYRPRVEPSANALRDALARSLDRDRARGFTAEGPHGDDLDLIVRKATPARHHASQGQHRSLVLALKVAELDVLSRRTGRVPLFLLDDVSSELDRTRNRRFFELLARLGGQVFLTTTHPEFILLDRDRVDFEVEDGGVIVNDTDDALQLPAVT